MAETAYLQEVLVNSRVLSEEASRVVENHILGAGSRLGFLFQLWKDKMGNSDVLFCAPNSETLRDLVLCALGVSGTSVLLTSSH